MKYIKTFESFSVNEVFTGLIPATLIWLLIRTMNKENNSMVNFFQRRGEDERLRKLPKENDVRAINEFVEKYMKDNANRVSSENKEEIEKIKSRINPGINIDKKMNLYSKILKFYFDDLKDNNNLYGFLRSLQNIKLDESLELVIGALYFRLELNKLMNIDSESIETETQSLQRFLKLTKNNFRL